MKIKAKFSFFAVMGVILCTDREHTALMCVAACFLHELGHIAAMLIEHKPPQMIVLYGGGIHIGDGGSSSLFVRAGGCAVNLLLFAAFYFLPTVYDAKLFGVINLLLMFFNILPISGLDGKGILEHFLLKRFSPEMAIRISDIAEKIAAAAVIPVSVLFILSGVMSFSALIFFFYLLAVDIFDKI